MVVASFPGSSAPEREIELVHAETIRIPGRAWERGYSGLPYLGSLAHSGAVLGPLKVDHTKLVTVCVIHTVEKTFLSPTKHSKLVEQNSKLEKQCL